MPAAGFPDAPAPVVGEIDAVLQDLLRHMPPDWRESKPGRPRIRPSVAVWGGVLVCVLRTLRTQLDLWRLLSEDQLWD